MNSSHFAAGKMHIALALLAVCAMILAPFMEVKAQAAPQGTLTVNKVIMGTTTSQADDFSFLINGASSTAFEADGSNQVTLNVGTYDITEDPVAGFSTTYSGCDNVVLTATNSPTCTITNTANATTGTLVVQKVVSGGTADEDDFSFKINGGATTTFEADGSNVITGLATGTYAVVENAAANYTPSYSNCASAVVTAGATTTCTITNTFTGTSTATSTGTLVVNKVLNGGNAATSSFSFRINGGATTTFESDGSNVVQDLAVGTYAITEVPAANYTPTYSNCASAVITANATTTCTITNNFNVGGAQLYEITGLVWDDENENGVLDGGESMLQNWVVSASQTGEITRTDSTDANGRYFLLVTDGSWLVSQSTLPNWDQTFPAGGTHTVNATGTATSTIPLGDYNFGNDQDSSGGGGGGGNGRRVELRDDDDDDDDTDGGGGTTDDDDEDDDDDISTPGGSVLGEQTSIYPYGAPDTGRGGSQLHKMDGAASIPLISMIMVMLVGLGFLKAVTDRREEEEETV